MTLAIIICIYVILGGCVYWGLSKQEKHFTSKLMEMHGYDSVLRYYEDKHYIHVERFSKFYVIVMPALVITLWALWPVVTMVSLVWNVIDYKHVIKEMEEKRELESI